MWKSFFLAVGIMMCIVGVECMLIERATLTDSAALTHNVSMSPDAGRPMVVNKDVVPPEWAPWSLMSTGVVVIIYSFTLARRVTG